MSVHPVMRQNFAGKRHPIFYNIWDPVIWHLPWNQCAQISEESACQEFVCFQSMAHFWSENKTCFSPSAFLNSVFSSSSPCSNAGFKCDQEQGGKKKQRRACGGSFAAFWREHVALDRRAVCNATRIICYIRNTLYSQYIIFLTDYNLNTRAVCKTRPGQFIFFCYYWIQSCNIYTSSVELQYK